MNQLERIDRALRSADSISALCSLVMDLAVQGHPKSEILGFLKGFLTRLQEGEEDREADENVLMDVMDFLVGWCSPHVKLLTEETGKNRHEPSDL